LPRFESPRAACSPEDGRSALHRLRVLSFSSLLPILPTVFLVRHHVANVNPAGPIVDVCRQAVLVSSNVEDRELADCIRMRIRLSNVYETGPPRSLRRPIPVVEGRLR